MRTPIVLSTAAVLAALTGSGGVAAAASSAPAGVPSGPSITVNGTGTEAVTPGTAGADLATVYSNALAAALTAAQAKAAFVASKESVALGAIANVTENTDVPASVCTVSPIEAAAPTVSGKGHARKKKPAARKPAAKKAQIVMPGGGCTVQAQVTVTYLIAGPAAVTTSTTTTTTSVTTTATATPVSTTTTATQ